MTVTASTIAQSIADAKVAEQGAAFLMTNRMVYAVLGDHGVKLASIKRAMVTEQNWADKTWSNYVSAVRSLAKTAKKCGFGDDVMAFLGNENEELDEPIWSLQNAAKRWGTTSARKVAKPAEEATEESAEESAEEAAEESKGSPLSVILGLLPHLSAADRAVVVMECQLLGDAEARNSVSA